MQTALWGAYFVHHPLVKHDNSLFVLKAKQGEKMGRPGVMEVEAQMNHAEPVHVRIAGRAVVVFQTELMI